MFLVWSNLYGAWVRQGRNGYTGSIDEAGFFDLDEAGQIARLENVTGMVERVDPFTGRGYAQFAAVVLNAPALVAA